MIINVTQEDIDKGWQASAAKCPVTRAANRTLKPPYSVLCTQTYCTLGLERDKSWTRVEKFYFPTEVHGRIAAYDAGMGMIPFSFELPIDQYC